jgi:nicotinamide-nucleotide amidase
MPTVEVLSQGDEVVTGQVADTNAAWLSEQLTHLGFEVVRHTTVGDKLDDIVGAMLSAAERADFAIGTGGLGPTDDDLTAQAVAAAFERPLALDEIAMAAIEAMYARFNRVMPEVNRKQALLPTGAVRLDNEWGTAPGFAVANPQCLLAFLPGVPREMRAMFPARVLPLLHERFELSPRRLVTLRTTGIGESNLQERIGTPTDDRYIVSYRTKLPENHLKLRIRADVPDDEVRAITHDIAGRIGSPLFSIEGLGAPGGDLATVVGRHLLQHDQTLAVAESCTGGRIAAMCTSVPGSSGWFLEGAVTYTNAAKVRMLGVDASAIEANGAVSEVVARQMAAGARERSGATFGLSTTGIAGPGGGTDTKPVGTVHIALAHPGGTTHRRLSYGFGRARVQQLSAAAAVDLLRRHLSPSLD